MPRSIRALAAAVAAALALSACADPEPADELAAALEATLDGPFGFGLQVDADGDALSRLGPDAAALGGLLAALEVRGRVDERRRVALEIALLGQAPVLELRRLGPDSTFIRLETVLVLAALGADVDGVRERAELMLDGLDLPPRAEAGVLAAFDGEWVGVEGRLDADASPPASSAPASAASTGGAADATSLRAALGDDLAGFVDRYVTVTRAAAPGEERRLAIDLRLRDLLDALGRAAAGIGAVAGDAREGLGVLPAVVPGQAAIVDGRVRALSFDVGAATPSGDAGAFVVTLTFTDDAEVAPVGRPDGAVVVPADAFLAGARRAAEAAAPASAGASGAGSP